MHKRAVSCPTCHAPVIWGSQSPFRPFCSERCRQIDLGVWASDGYCIPGNQPTDDFSVPDLPPTSRE